MPDGSGEDGAASCPDRLEAPSPDLPLAANLGRESLPNG